MKFYRLLLLIFIGLLNHLSLNGKDGEVFSSELLMNTNVNDEYILQKLDAAIQSNETNLQYHVIHELGKYVEHLHNVHLINQYAIINARPIQNSTRTKKFLISHFKAEHARYGFDYGNRLNIEIMSQVTENLASSNEDSVSKIQGESPGIKYVSEEIQVTVSPWLKLPIILVTLWQKDPDVLEFLWEFKKNDRIPKPNHLLHLFNVGMFDTMEVNDYRMSELVSFVGYQEDAYTAEVVSLAARGLAISHPEKAIPDLIHAGLNQMKPRAEILITLSGYRFKQLDPYYEQLVPLVHSHVTHIKRKDKFEKAINRLEPYASMPRPDLDIPTRTVGAPTNSNEDSERNKETKLITDNSLADVSISDERILRLLEDAIQDLDSENRRYLIQELGKYAELLSPPPVVALDRSSISVRPIHRFPELKEMLFHHFEREHANSEFNSGKQLQADIQKMISATSDSSKSRSLMSESDEAIDVEAISDNVQNYISPWLRIPTILATFWPQDSEVLEFLWKYKEREPDLEPFQLLKLFSIGKFDTPKVNNFRISQLVSAGGAQESFHTGYAISLAAKGLALSHPEEAIPELIQAGLNQAKPRADILITLAGYTNEQLDPYYTELKPLISARVTEISDLHAFDDAIARLEAYASSPR